MVTMVSPHELAAIKERACGNPKISAGEAVAQLHRLGRREVTPGLLGAACAIRMDRTILHGSQPDFCNVQNRHVTASAVSPQTHKPTNPQTDVSLSAMSHAIANISRPILVVDLEATCDDGDQLAADEMEIIEIGAVWASPDGTVLDAFQTLVRPVLHPQLTAFCLQLVGIPQADIDAAEPFPAAASALAQFAKQHQAQGALWGSWGGYDARQLARDCERHGTVDPLAGFTHVNLKREFAKVRKIKEVGMARALTMVGMPLGGAHHRGLDDARNIAKLLPWSLGRGG